ncbi:MAG: hypothetical protein QNK24_00010 [Desulfuromusa sp.]|nr:hypothetical protein [Desulfuromusa sp.]
MIVGQKVGCARVSTSAQDLSLQKERLADCARIRQPSFLFEHPLVSRVFQLLSRAQYLQQEES